MAALRGWSGCQSSQPLAESVKLVGGWSPVSSVKLRILVLFRIASAGDTVNLAFRNGKLDGCASGESGVLDRRQKAADDR